MDVEGPAPSQQSLEVCWDRRKQLRWVAVVLGIGCLYPLGGVAGLIDAWLVWFGIVVFGAGAAVGLVQTLRLPRGWVVRLGTDGVEVRGERRVPWSDLAEVRITGMQPRWLFLLGRRSVPVASFVPRRDVELPAVPLPGTAPWARKMRRRLYGTDLLVPVGSTTVGREELVAVVRRLSDLPVEDRLAR